eukprot:TRINITY_DN21106_c0_g1_i1.p1 TRINITY_DN21106_c0_g1~~TRINITY_DN21106_c0_g1_i1.p1  ORF type:complete len:383 (+),score=114.27 TRINITY_DN21106_c0_g1_i1:44-1192(+)
MISEPETLRPFGMETFDYKCELGVLVVNGECIEGYEVIEEEDEELAAILPSQEKRKGVIKKISVKKAMELKGERPPSPNDKPVAAPLQVGTYDDDISDFEDNAELPACPEPPPEIRTLAYTAHKQEEDITKKLLTLDNPSEAIATASATAAKLYVQARKAALDQSPHNLDPVTWEAQRLLEVGRLETEAAYSQLNEKRQKQKKKRELEESIRQEDTIKRENMVVRMVAKKDVQTLIESAPSQKVDTRRAPEKETKTSREEVLDMIKRKAQSQRRNRDSDRDRDRDRNWRNDRNRDRDREDRRGGRRNETNEKSRRSDYRNRDDDRDRRERDRDRNRNDRDRRDRDRNDRDRSDRDRRRARRQRSSSTSSSSSSSSSGSSSRE